MKQRLLALLLVLPALVVAEEVVIDAEKLSMDDLFYHAHRGTPTDVRRTNRERASAELQARGVETLTFYLENVHIENIWYFVQINGFMPRPGFDGLAADEVMPVFRKALKSDNKKTRRAALFYLQRYERPSENIDWLLPHLENDDDINLTIRLLGHWQEAGQAERIASFLESGKERRRINAVVALGELRQDSSVPALLDMLKDDVFTVRYAASRSLVQMDATKAVRQALKDAAKGDDVQYLRHLIQTAGALQDRWAKGLLRRMQDHKDEGVRLDVERAIHEIDHDADSETHSESLADFLGLPLIQ